MGQERTVLALWRSALLIKSRINGEYDNEGDSDSDNASNSGTRTRLWLPQVKVVDPAARQLESSSRRAWTGHRLG